MATPTLRHKHLRLDQRKIDFAKRYFSVSGAQEAIDRALALLMQEAQITRKLKSLQGLLRGDNPVAVSVIGKVLNEFQRIAGFLPGLSVVAPGDSHLTPAQRPL